MIVPTCTIFVEAPQSKNIYINAKHGETYQAFIARAVDQLKHHADLSDKDTPVLSAFFLMNISQNNKLNYSTRYSPSNPPTYHITISGDRTALPQSNQQQYIPPLIESTTRKVYKTQFILQKHLTPAPQNENSNLGQQTPYSTGTSISIAKQTLYVSSEANKRTDPILRAFFNSENLDRVTVETSKDDKNLLIDYKKCAIDTGWFSSWFQG